MEGAAGGVVLAGLFQLDARGDHVDDIGAVEQVIDKGLWDQAGHRRSGYCRARRLDKYLRKPKDSAPPVGGAESKSEARPRPGIQALRL
ncbi:hypothetical protein D9M69_712240 [compost metagenome]